jgi:predicted dehydrogenase
MRVGIVGEPDRCKAWEDLLVSSSIVTEVSLSRVVAAQKGVDTVVLLEEGDHRFEAALEAIRMGCHVFIVSKLPAHRREAELLYHTSEEAGVVVQFAHWATFSSASQWMLNTVKKPDFIHIQREMTHAQFEGSSQGFGHYLIEDVAIALKWADSNVHRIEANASRIKGELAGAHLLIRFDNGSTAVIYQQVTNTDSRHIRYASNNQHIVQCNVPEQSVRHGQLGPNGLFFEKRFYEHTDAANMAVSLFLKAIQMRKPAAYTALDALKLVYALELVEERLGLLQ